LNVIARNNVVITGQGPEAPAMVFAHGFGCDQHMWRFVAPAFEATHRVVLFDHVGCGKADNSSYDLQRHARLDGYAEDMVDVLRTLDLRNAVLVGHSVSAMIAVLASLQAPERVGRLILVGPSPRYLNDTGYHGGFEREDIDGLLDLMERNLLGWADFLAPAVMGPQAGPERTQELHASFCAGDPEIGRRFAAVTFLADNRADLPKVTVPALVIQCADDAIAPMSVGQYTHAHIRGSRLAVLDASGHCPHMTHPEQTIALIRGELGLS
jgi:sigma-B regulation protein RsbQ